VATPLPSPALRRALRERLVAWYRVHRRDLPWRRTRDPYAIWVSEAMLQQTRVEAVEGYWQRFMRRFPTVADLAAASEEEVLAAWSGLGYYRRARSLHEAARAVVEVHGGRFPDTRDGLRSLPGVGPYTAGALLSIAFEAAEPLVDGNVERVFARLFELAGARGSRELAASCWRIAAALVPPAPPKRTQVASEEGASRPVVRSSAPTPGEWNQALMELGATVCTPRAPGCGVCPLALQCAARAAGTAESLPPPKATPAPIDVALEVYVAWSPGDRGEGAPRGWTRSEVRAGLWLERRAADGRMGGLWQFPTVEVPPDGGALYLFPEVLDEAPGFALEPAEELFTLRHAITHHRIRLRIRAATVHGRPPEHWRAVDPTEARGMPLSGMARKVLARLDSSRGGLLADGGEA
jgi:A/G-specific adenine glycosylase